MNLDTRWCDLSTRDYLIVERAWGWTTGVISSAIIAGGALLWRFFHRRRLAKLHEPPPALLRATPEKPCPCCFQSCDPDIADYYTKLLERGVELERATKGEFRYPPRDQ
jgi:hypothetical protein